MTFKRITAVGIVAALLAGVIALGMWIGEADAGARQATLRVGSFDTRGVALAYGRSDGFMAWVNDLRKELEEAKEKGDDVRAKELESLGPEIQEKLHQQVFGGAPIDDILIKIESELPAIARKAGVHVIVQDVLYRSPEVEVVDITREMAAPFHPDEKTLEIMEQLLKQPPVDME
jgi:hypothetical protein